MTATTAAVAPRPSRSWRRLLAEALVSPRSTDPPRRRPADAGLVVVSALLLALIATRDRIGSGAEVDLAVFLNGLPQAASGAVLVALRFGSLWVVGLIAALGVLAHRRTLAAELLLAGGLAWGLGRAIARWYGEQLPPADVVVHNGGLQQLPVVRIAVAVAVVWVAAPHLTRLARRGATLILLVMAIAAVSLGIGLPSDVLAGLLVGWIAASTVRLAFGSPAGRPSLEQIADALLEIGVAVADLDFAAVQEAGTTQVVARAPSGATLCIQAYGRDERDAQLLSKLWRYVWYEDSGPTLYVTRLQQVEHQAYAMLRAARAGVGVPEVVAATTAGPATAVLVEHRPLGTAASEAGADELTDERLAAMWRALALLHQARVAHGALDLSKVVLTADGGVALVDFRLAATSASDATLAADAARLLAATSLEVGPERAVAAVQRVLGDHELVAMLPFLQPPVLTDPVRHAYRRDRGSLAKLRSCAAAAGRVEAPPLVQLERVRPRTVLFAALTFVGVYALFSELGDVSAIRAELSGASWGWVAVAGALSALTNVGYALAYVGATSARMPFGRTLVLQAAGSFTNVVAPNGLGTAAINARFMQVRGVALPAALSSLFLNTAVSAVVQVVLFAAMVPVAGTRIDLSLVPWDGIFVAAIGIAVAVILIAAVLWRVPRARHHLTHRARPAVDHLHVLLRSPAKLTLIVVGQLVVQVLFAATLGASCLAFGASVAFSTLLLVNIATSTLSGLVPAPGGLGVAEATLAGALTASGVPAPTAIAITLVYRLVTMWIPTVPGWFALQALERGDDL